MWLWNHLWSRGRWRRAGGQLGQRWVWGFGRLTELRSWPSCSTEIMSVPIASTTADGTFAIKDKAGTIGIAIIGGCVVIVLFVLGGIGLLIWLLTRKKKT